MVLAASLAAAGFTCGAGACWRGDERHDVTASAATGSTGGERDRRSGDKLLEREREYFLPMAANASRAAAPTRAGATPITTTTSPATSGLFG